MALVREIPGEWEEWLRKVSQFCNLNIEVAPLLTKKTGDNRPYLEVYIAGKKIVGLLDSGANHTVIGAKGLESFMKLGIVIHPIRVAPVVTADGTEQRVTGILHLPVELEGEIRIITALSVPTMSQPIIFGMDLWKEFKIIPDVHDMTYHRKWSPREVPVEVGEVRVIQPRKELSYEENLVLNEVIERFKTLSPAGLGRTSLTEHKIITGDAEPIKQRYYPLSPAMQSILNGELDKMLELGVIEPSTSPWSSPVLLVKKPLGDYRLCLDSRKLNSVTKRDAYPLPYVSSILDKLGHAKYLSSIDLKKAFWQIPLETSSKEKTAFTAPGRGLFQFTVLPFGLHNAAQTQQRLMDRLLGPELEPNVFVYLDDIIIATDTFEKHMETLEVVLNSLKKASLTINIDKCEFCRPSLNYLGYVVDGLGLRTNPDKIEAIVNYPLPSTITELKRFMGMCSWYKRFIGDFSTLTAPLNDLTKLKKNSGEKGARPYKKGDRKRMHMSAHLTWNKEATEAFSELKSRLVSAPILACPDFHKPFVIQADASDYGLGVVLTQGEESEEKVIAYASRSLSRAERNYSTTERECLAVVFGVEKFRSYIEGTTFSVITDHHSLLWLSNLKEPGGRLARWAVKLQQYDFTLIHRKGKDHVVPDALSRAVKIEISNVDFQEDETDSWYRNMKEKIAAEPTVWRDWRLEGEKLYKFVGEDWKMVVPRAVRKRILFEGHDHPTSAHLGIRKTIGRISQKYYWPKMRVDISRYVRGCEVCQAHKVPRLLPTGLMGQPRKVDRPWQMISTDLMGPFPRSKNGNTFLLVICDWFTKFCLLFPLRAATGKAIAKHIENDVFLVYGVPEIIVCDNGPQYISKVLKSLTETYGISKLWYNARYHPQSNPTERINQVVKIAISSYIADDQRNWDLEIPKIGYAIRTAVHEVTGYTPSFLNFGREIISSGNEYGDGIATDEEIEIDIRERRYQEIQRLVPIYKEVQLRLKKAYEKSAHHYNLRRRPITFEKGQTVWKRNYTLSDASKQYSASLAPKFIKCRVSSKVSPLVYVLEDMEGRKLGKWHVKDIKPHYEDEDVNNEA